MEVVRRGEDPLAANDGCGEWKYQRSERHRRSRLKLASSDPKLKLLDEKTTFPNVSKLQQDCLKDAFFGIPFRDAYVYIPFPPAPIKECEIRSCLDAETPIYSQSFEWKPTIGVGKQLNVLDLLGDKLLFGFNTSSQNVHSIQPTEFTSSAGSLDPMMGTDRGFGPGMCMSSKGSPNVQRIQPLKFRSSYMASASVTTPSKDSVIVGSDLILKGKYVMIFCVFVPSIWSSADAPMIYHTALASHELARRDDFVLVVVPMMRKGFTRSWSAYQHFLSGFSCFAVPFRDFRRREYICSALGFDGEPKVLILDPSQKVLYHGKADMFRWVGGAEGDCFPFSPDRVWTFKRDESGRRDHSLNELLGLGDTDVLYNIEYLAGGRLKEGGRITISELKQKVVGIYLCSSGWSLQRLLEVYEECKRREYELEIVVVGYPFLEQVPPKLFEKFVIEALGMMAKQLDWWFFPFNNTVCHRLWRMREVYSGEEGLFIVDPSMKYVDPHGLRIICDFGVDAYPFTGRKLIEEEHQRKMGLRLESLLLPWTHVCCKCDSGSIAEIPVAEVLKDKIVVLYLYKEPKKRCFAEELAAWYKINIKGKHPNVEVVTVSLDGIECDDDDKDFFMDMGWLQVCPADPSKSAKLCDEYFHPHCGKHEVLVTFGEDGRILSVDGSQLLASHGPPFHGNSNNLRAEIGRECHKGGLRYVLLAASYV